MQISQMNSKPTKTHILKTMCETNTNIVVMEGREQFQDDTHPIRTRIENKIFAIIIVDGKWNLDDELKMALDMPDVAQLMFFFFFSFSIHIHIDMAWIESTENISKCSIFIQIPQKKSYEPNFTSFFFSHFYSTKNWYFDVQWTVVNSSHFKCIVINNGLHFYLLLCGFELLFSFDCKSSSTMQQWHQSFHAEFSLKEMTRIRMRT